MPVLLQIVVAAAVLAYIGFLIEEGIPNMLTRARDEWVAWRWRRRE